MHYILLIYGDESQLPDPGTTESGARWSEFQVHRRVICQTGALVAGGALHPTSSATTIQVVDDTVHTSDGPSTDGSRALCGYFVIDVEDLDRALDVAARLPGARRGAVEVRPVMEEPP